MKHASPAIFVFTLWLLVIAPLPSAHALSVNYSFTGHITSVDSCGPCPPLPFPAPLPLADFSIGSPIFGVVRYDTTLLRDTDPSPLRGDYEQLNPGPSPSFVITMNVSGFVFKGDGPFFTQVETSPNNSFTYQSLSFDLIHAPSPVNYTWDGDEIGIILGGSFTNDSMPTTLDLNGHGRADLFLTGFIFGGLGGQMDVSARGRIDSFTPVPEPSTMVLMGFGLLGIVAVRTRFCVG